MAEVLSRGRAGGHRRQDGRLDRRFHQSERREVPRPDRLPQHGQSDFVRRTRPEVPRVRELPAECRAPAARRARRADDAEPAAVSDRPVRRPARRLCRRQLQPAVHSARAPPSTRQFGRGSDRRTGKLRSDARKGDRRHGGPGCRRHRRGRPTGRASGADRQFRPASYPARHSRLAAGAGGALQSRPRAWAAASVHGTAPSSRTMSRFFNIPAERPACRKGRC